MSGVLSIIRQEDAVYLNSNAVQEINVGREQKPRKDGSPNVASAPLKWGQGKVTEVKIQWKYL